jgi:hypothetical protein
VVVGRVLGVGLAPVGGRAADGDLRAVGQGDAQVRSRVLVDGDPARAIRLQLAHERGGEVVGQVGELDLTGVVGERDVGIRRVETSTWAWARSWLATVQL